MMQPRHRLEAEAYCRSARPRQSNVVGIAFLIAALTLAVVWALWR